MSGNFPFDLLMGDRLPSSWYKYFSFWRNTFETVLQSCQRGNRHTTHAVVPSLNTEHGCNLVSGTSNISVKSVTTYLQSRSA